MAETRKEKQVRKDTEESKVEGTPDWQPKPNLVEGGANENPDDGDDGGSGRKAKSGAGR
jgi:hypothetical protein